MLVPFSATSAATTASDRGECARCFDSLCVWRRLAQRVRQHAQERPARRHHQGRPAEIWGVLRGRRPVRYDVPARRPRPDLRRHGSPNVGRGRERVQAVGVIEIIGLFKVIKVLLLDYIYIYSLFAGNYSRTFEGR